MKKTSADYERERKKRLKQQGRERLELWPKKEHKPLIIKYAKDLENELPNIST